MPQKRGTVCTKSRVRDEADNEPVSSDELDCGTRARKPRATRRHRKQALPTVGDVQLLLDAARSLGDIPRAQVATQSSAPAPAAAQGAEESNAEVCIDLTKEDDHIPSPAAKSRRRRPRPTPARSSPNNDTEDVEEISTTQVARAVPRSLIEKKSPNNKQGSVPRTLLPRKSPSKAQISVPSCLLQQRKPKNHEELAVPRSLLAKPAPRQEEVCVPAHMLQGARCDAGANQGQGASISPSGSIAGPDQLNEHSDLDYLSDG